VIVNSYAVLDAFACLLRLGLVAPIIWLAVAGLIRWRRSAADPAARRAVEERLHLLFLLASVQLVLNFLAWPLFYLLLQSYIPNWPGVMCIYGVTRVGAGTIGTSRFLPPLIDALQLLKPVLVFISGMWFVLHLVNRQTRTASITAPVLVCLLAAGTVAGVDAVSEVAYLAIPKKEEFQAAGCCSAGIDRSHDARRLVPLPWMGGEPENWLPSVYYAANLGAAALLAAMVRFRLASTKWIIPLAIVAAATLFVNRAYLVEVAAPRLLHQPDHHCPYDLVEAAPASIAAVGLFVAGSFCTGWACCVRWVGRRAASSGFAATLDSALLALAALAYASSVLTLSAAIALA
jgi:hypothetical protein